MYGCSRCLYTKCGQIVFDEHQFAFSKPLRLCVFAFKFFAMSQFTRLVLVRHGETAANRELRYIGTRDDALTDTGHAQAQLLAEALAVLPIAAVYSSPRSRARDTAQPIAQQLGLTVVVADELRETAYGEWEGMSRAEVLAHSPAWQRLLPAWEGDASVAPPGGESVVDMTKRVVACAELLAARHAQQTIIVVSHVGPVKALVAATLGVGPEVARNTWLDQATISVVDWHEHRRSLRLFNSHAHLGWGNALWMQRKG